MTVEEVGQGLMDCFQLDLNGGIYAVTPDNPLIDVVNGTLRLFVLSMIIGKVFNAIGYKPEVIDEKKQLIFIVGFMFICFSLLQCIFSFLF